MNEQTISIDRELSAAITLFCMIITAMILTSVITLSLVAIFFFELPLFIRPQLPPGLVW